MAANLWAKGRTSLLVAVAGVVTLIASNSFSPKESIAQSPKDGDGSGSPSITTDGAPKVAAPRKSIDEIFAEIATKAPGFGGAFLSPDPSETAAFVYLTDPSQEKLDQFVSVVQRDYGSELGPLMATTDIRAVQGKYDYVELKNWYDLAVARTVGVKGVRTTDIQEGNNRLEFGVKTEEARSEVLAILKEIGVPDDATFVLTTTDPVQPLDSLQGYYRPLIGGLQIESAVSQCTLGFQAVIGGVEGFFTAHHCTANRGSVSGEYFDQPTWNSYQVGA